MANAGLFRMWYQNCSLNTLKGTDCLGLEQCFPSPQAVPKHDPKKRKQPKPYDEAISCPMQVLASQIRIVAISSRNDLKWESAS